MKKVLITGADGFIGSHLTEMLLNSGRSVRALSQYNSFGNRGWLEDLKQSDELELVAGDVRDLHFCEQLMADVSEVYHLAALIAIPFSYQSPRSYIDTNIIGTENICRAALSQNVGKVLITSTSEVYGTAKYVPIDEEHPLQAQSPYSASKIGADSVAKSYQASFGLPLVIVRPFNTYGPRQSARAVIPTVISQIAAGKSELALGDLSPTRDFNFVFDTCRAFIDLANEPLAVGETVNIGSGKEISVKDLALLIAELMGRDISITADNSRMRPQNSEVFRLLADTSKARSLINYEPQFSLRDGLQETIEWFCRAKNLAGYKPDEYAV